MTKRRSGRDGSGVGLASLDVRAEPKAPSQCEIIPEQAQFAVRRSLTMASCAGPSVPRRYTTKPSPRYKASAAPLLAAADTENVIAAPRRRASTTRDRPMPWRWCVGATHSEAMVIWLDSSSGPMLASPTSVSPSKAPRWNSLLDRISSIDGAVHAWRGSPSRSASCARANRSNAWIRRATPSSR